ncbi:hypothetical protein D8Y20_01525 [Mariprofundus sp. EBB-1]|uniref:hypothetical protein n=1 Tax=Mariprofundus sp. EBB-1 TaxID=2650971 RepID=UPI000EF1B545|nr:hypothetical protein [Mariprofundus sp. EBB-1]RLL55608.1 hypothetical protein D8Y20_01525 [Mariprofundus sp. EBB-1]
MNNTQTATVIASISFDFRGKRFEPSITVDLHTMMLKKQPLNYLYVLLGASIDLDAYRHEYDVMVMHAIVYSEPTGLACDFFTDGTLDFEGFTHAWHKMRILSEIEAIAEQHLNISDLMQQPDIQQALIESYQAGQKNPIIVKKGKISSPF